MPAVASSGRAVAGVRRIDIASVFVACGRGAAGQAAAVTASDVRTPGCNKFAWLRRETTLKLGSSILRRTSHGRRVAERGQALRSSARPRGSSPESAAASNLRRSLAAFAMRE